MSRLAYISAGAITAGTAIGFVSVLWIAAHPESLAAVRTGPAGAVLGVIGGAGPSEEPLKPSVDAKPRPLDIAATPTPKAAGLSVNPTADELGGLNVDNMNQGGQPTAGDSNDLTAELLKSYEQYKANPSGLYQDLRVGDGAEAASGKKVAVQYRGWLTDGTVFDESYARGQAFSFTLGAGQVISGWDQGVNGMKVGGKRRLIIPPAVGYGNQAVGPIPAGSLLVFEVELEGVQ